MRRLSNIRLETLVVASTPEAMSFWVRQGLHTLAASPPQLRTAVRALQQSGMRTGFANSVTMARLLPRRHAPVVAEAVERVRSGGAPRTLSSVEAPAVLGYEDVNSLGNFTLQPDGSRRAVQYLPHEQLRVNVPYSKLQAFVTMHMHMRMQCTCNAHAVHMRCTCGAHAVHAPPWHSRLV